MKYIKFLGLGLIIMLGIKTSLMAQPFTVQTGTTNKQSSQLIYWYDQAFNQVGFPLGRFTTFQLTNASTAQSVTVKIQFFLSFNPVPGDPRFAVRCVQRDFFDTYTPLDTHVYNLFDLFTNALDPLGFPTFVDIDLLNTKGFIVVTPVNADLEAISFQHLFGNSYVFDANNSTMHRLNAMGRDARNFSTPFAIVPDGTALDGVNAGFVLIQPDILKFNFESFFTKSPFFPNLADIISISFIDNYGGGVGGTYAAEPGQVEWDNPLIIDEFEFPLSCDNLVQDCFFDIGLNDVIGVANPLLDDGLTYCAGNSEGDGWARTEVIGYDELENELGIVAFSSSQDAGDAYWMNTEPEGILFPTPTPPVVTPTPSPSPSPSPPVTPTPTPTPGACTSNDDCPPDDRCQLNPDSPDFQMCIARTGSGSGCGSITGPVQLSTAMVNILIPLVPAIGIGLRMLRRRNKNMKEDQA